MAYQLDRQFNPGTVETLPPPPVQATPETRRARLIELLRDRSSWPPNFAWNFQNCSTCALGLAWETICVGAPHSGRNHIDPLLGLSYAESGPVFAPTTLLDGTAEGYGIPRYLVTPEMVADRLEALHNRIALREAAQ